MILDAAFFKRLSHNDSGQAQGHQGGIVIPRDLAEFFPPLPSVTAHSAPTVDQRLQAELYVDGVRVATVETRYQHQTWGGTRSAERRLTDNLGPLRKLSREGDFVLFSKDLSDDHYIRLNLVRQGTAIHAVIAASVGNRRWGPINPATPPVSLSEISFAEEEISEVADEPGSAFGDDRALTETTTMRKARDRAFRKRVLLEYDYRCAFTGRKFVSPLSKGILGLDAAHVVPVQNRGSDHPANGLPLTKDLHWAFDRGMIGVSMDRKISVPDSVVKLDGNQFLRDLHGLPIREAVTPQLRVLEAALAWHRENVLIH